MFTLYLDLDYHWISKLCFDVFVAACLWVGCFVVFGCVGVYCLRMLVLFYCLWCGFGLIAFAMWVLCVWVLGDICGIGKLIAWFYVASIVWFAWSCLQCSLLNCELVLAGLYGLLGWLTCALGFDVWWDRVDVWCSMLVLVCLLIGCSLLGGWVYLLSGFFHRVLSWVGGWTVCRVGFCLILLGGSFGVFVLYGTMFD